MTDSQWNSDNITLRNPLHLRVSLIVLCHCLLAGTNRHFQTRISLRSDTRGIDSYATYRISANWIYSSITFNWITFVSLSFVFLFMAKVRYGYFFYLLINLIVSCCFFLFYFGFVFLIVKFLIFRNEKSILNVFYILLSLWFSSKNKQSSSSN